MTQPDIQVRPARPGDATGIAQVHVDSWRTTYKGIVSDATLAALSVEARADFWGRTLAEPDNDALTYVVDDASAKKIVGFASAGPERENNPEFRGELYAIYLLEEHQGQGLGKRLTAAAVDGLRSTGYGTMLVWVLADNPARRYYQAIGGAEIGSKPVEIGGDTFEEIALGWRDIETLAARLRAR